MQDTKLPTEQTSAIDLPASKLPALMAAAIDVKVKKDFSYGEIAQGVGDINRQTIHQWHTKQTLPIKHLLTITRVFAAFGYKLSFNLEKIDSNE